MPYQRPDGRNLEGLRPVTIIQGFTPYAEGSALIQLGNTHVLCNASVLETVPAFLRGQASGWVTAEYSMLPRATHTRGVREAVQGKQSGRTQEIQRLIGRSLRAVCRLDYLGERTIHIDCDVLQADGGTRCASITGAWVALQLAVNHLMAQGKLQHNPIVGQVAAVSVGCLDGQHLLDLCYAEDARCDADVNVVLNDQGQLIEIQGTAEGAPFSVPDLNALVVLAQQGAQTLLQAQQQALLCNKHP